MSEIEDLEKKLADLKAQREEVDIYAGLKQPYQDVTMQTHHLRMIIELLGENRDKPPSPFTETEAKETMQELARAYGVMAFAKDYPEYEKWMLDL